MDKKDNVTQFPGALAQLSDEANEDTVLGALLNADGHPLDCREEVIDIFGSAGGQIFTNAMNRKIYGAFMQCLIEGASTSSHGAIAILRREGELSDEAMERVYRISGSAGGPVEAVNGARVLRDLHRRRLVSTAMDEGSRMVRSGELVADVAISDAFAQVATAVEAGEAPTSRFERGSLVDEGLGVILGLRQRVPGIAFGYPDLDERTTGMHPTHLTAIGARSGGGKTVIAMNVARHAAMKQQIPTVVFSLEMSPGDLIQRAASAELGILYNDIRENNLTPEQREQIRKFADREYENKNFRIEYVPGATAGELYLLARKSIRDMGAQLFVVDYAQSVQSDRGTPEENAKMSETIPRIHDISTKLNTHVLLLSQLKKPVQGREGEAPGVMDLLYGTKIENVATTIMMAHRRLVEGKPGSEVEMHTVKNRNGTLGEDELVFDGARMRFLPPGVRLSGGWDQQ
ncbi:DnaB-like dsDNA helicase [Streptomyces phage Kradal]|nr:DnaB-like dsDNA helicase [Streptomyces phage Kradal]QPL14499.1 DnaB-like dsDNA helicase [Streptomyces phage EhyElimayoE]